MRTDGATSMARDPTFGLWENFSNWDSSHSSFDIGQKESKVSVSVKSTKKSASDLVLETYVRSLSGRSSSLSSVESFVFPSIEMALDSTLLTNSDDNLDRPNDKANDGVNKSVAIISLDMENPISEYLPVKKEIRRTYSVSKKNSGLSKIPLPHSAASFYCGPSAQMEVIEACESIKRLNGYLNARRTDVDAGVPGRFLNAVIGQDGSGTSTRIFKCKM